MAETKVLENGNLKVVLMILGFGVTIGTIVFAAGGLKGNIKTNTNEIHRVDESGCQPSINVRQELVGLARDIENNEKAVIKIDRKLDEILAILRPIRTPEP